MQVMRVTEIFAKPPFCDGGIESLSRFYFLHTSSQACNNGFE